jgi:hypothetical protein
VPFQPDGAGDPDAGGEQRPVGAVLGAQRLDVADDGGEHRLGSVGDGDSHVPAGQERAGGVDQAGGGVLHAEVDADDDPELGGDLEAPRASSAPRRTVARLAEVAGVHQRLDPRGDRRRRQRREPGDVGAGLGPGAHERQHGSRRGRRERRRGHGRRRRGHHAPSEAAGR